MKRMFFSSCEMVYDFDNECLISTFSDIAYPVSDEYKKKMRKIKKELDEKTEEAIKYLKGEMK